MYPQMTQIQPLTLIRRNRLLPFPGEVTVRPGQKVNATDVVAQASIPTRHYLVDVRSALGVSTVAAAEKLITRKPGDLLEKNDILAETGGLFSKVIRTPGPGRVISISKGRVLIETENETFSLQAGLAGKIHQVIDDRGVSIETYGALIQGVWGNSRIGFGQLLVDESSLDGELSASALSLTARGNILIAGFCSSEEMFTAARSAQISGLILGSMPSLLIPTALELSYPVILLTGFGKTGLDEYSRRILVTNAGRDISINAVRWNRLAGDRPEIYIPLPSEGEPYQWENSFSVGQKVRVHSGAYAGRIGRIDELIPGMTQLPNGLRASAARVKFDQRSGAVLPLVNLDVIQIKD